MRSLQANSVAAPKCLTLALTFTCLVLTYMLVNENSLNDSLSQITNCRGNEQVTPSSLPQLNTETERPTRPMFNLMEEKYGKHWKKNQNRYFSIESCTIEYANAEKLQQDHPCLIYLIQNNYLRKPAPRSVPYHLDNYLMVSKGNDPSDGQSQAILRILRNQTNGFFIESGANDGEYHSNTLYMERYLNWTGLLVEPGVSAYNRLMTRNRKAYTLQGCVSTKPYPIKVYFNVTDSPRSYIVDEADSDSTKNNKAADQSGDTSQSDPLSKQTMVDEVQCFPLYSILLAIGRTQVDFFSLDVEGAEYKVLSTIPWPKVDMTTLTVERNRWSEEDEPTMTRLMESNKFVKLGFIELDFTRDVVYMKDYLADFRYLYEDMLDN